MYCRLWESPLESDISSVAEGHCTIWRLARMSHVVCRFWWRRRHSRRRISLFALFGRFRTPGRSNRKLRTLAVRRRVCAQVRKAEARRTRLPLSIGRRIASRPAMALFPYHRIEGRAVGRICTVFVALPARPRWSNGGNIDSRDPQTRAKPYSNCRLQFRYRPK